LARRILKIIMRLSELSNSDKLTAVLTCVSLAVAFILYLVVKTPTSILVMCVAIVGLMFMPILHIWKRWITRGLLFTVLVLLVLVIGKSAWPKASGIDQAASVTSPPPQQSVSVAPTPAQKLEAVPDQSKRAAFRKGSSPVPAPANGTVSGSNNTTVGRIPFSAINGNV
jgi:hypothetical protein